jgi:hypothetical protein
MTHYAGIDVSLETSKSDAIDAEAAARAVLGGQAIGLPKSGTGMVEMIRHLKAARDTAVKARTQAMLTLKALGSVRTRANWSVWLSGMALVGSGISGAGSGDELCGLRLRRRGGAAGAHGPGLPSVPLP